MAHVRKFVIAATGAFATLLVAYEACEQYFSKHVDELQPRALPMSSRTIITRAIQQIVGGNVDPRQSAAWTDAAKRSLETEPLYASPLFVLAYQKYGRGEQERSKELALAENITRRNIPVLMALAQQSQRNDDIQGYLSYVDKIVRVQPQMTEMFVPELVKILQNPLHSPKIFNYAHREWIIQVLAQAVADQADRSEIIYRLMDQISLSQRGNERSIQSVNALRLRLRSQFLESNNAQQLISDFNRLSSNEKTTLASFEFSETNTSSIYSPYSWILYSKNESSTSIVLRNAIKIRAKPETQFLAAERVTFWQPGLHQIAQIISNEKRIPRATLTWTVICINSAKTTLWNKIFTGVNGQNTYIDSLSVPQGCGAQHWYLSATGASDMEYSTAILIVRHAHDLEDR